MMKMPMMKFLMLISAITLAVGSAYAYHDHGVAACATCHAMHGNSEEFEVPPSIDNNYLLLSDSPTDLCLSCHASDNGSVWANNPLSPAAELGGGNFVFSASSNINDGLGGNLYPLTGSHGVHNCISGSENLNADPLNVYSPGGSYPANSLGCTSCHDPHGNENFRMLWGVGHIPAGDFNFVYPAPVAEGLPLTGASESRTLHTAYHSGWTNWCANCHGYFHEHQPVGFAHPVRGPLAGTTRTSYERYNGTNDPTGGNPLTSYLPEVPFQSSLATTTSTMGPDKRGEITCVTCHRAHGSSAVDAGRWDFSVVDLISDGQISGSFRIPSPYNGQPEHQLCVKCHEPDTRTHGFNKACTFCHKGEMEGLRDPKLDPLPQFK